MIPIQYVVLKYINDQKDPSTNQPLYPVSMTEDAKTTILLFDHALSAHPLSLACEFWCEIPAYGTAAVESILQEVGRLYNPQIVIVLLFIVSWCKDFYHCIVLISVVCTTIWGKERAKLLDACPVARSMAVGKWDT